MAEQYPILKGAEPFYFEGNRTGILISHGFTGTAQSMRPIAEAYASTGYTVCLPRLKGHGTHYEDMESTSRGDWMASVEEGYQWLKKRCDRIAVTGLSMGGTLILYLAEKHPEIEAVIPINAAIDLEKMGAGKDLSNTRYLDAIGSDIKNPAVSELAYEKTPVKSLMELVSLTDEVRAELSRISCPALIFVSEEDHVVPPDNAEVIYEGISSEEKKIVTLQNSYHVATLDFDQTLIIEESLAFIEKVCSQTLHE
jgi:carboxylesterase